MLYTILNVKDMADSQSVSIHTHYHSDEMHHRFLVKPPYLLGKESHTLLMKPIIVMFTVYAVNSHFTLSTSLNYG